jgi:hypothetical protein
MLAFSIPAFVVSLLLSLLVFSDELIIIIPLVASATVFSGSLGFIFVNSFSGSKYKAMLLGAAITTITFIFSITISVLALKVNVFGYDAIFRIETYMSEIILTVGITGSFSAPLLLLLGAYIGIYVRNA